MKEIPKILLILAMAFYILVSAVGRLEIDRSKIEATRLSIEVLKLQLIELRSQP